MSEIPPPPAKPRPSMAQFMWDRRDSTVLPSGLWSLLFIKALKLENVTDEALDEFHKKLRSTPFWEWWVNGGFFGK